MATTFTNWVVNTYPVQNTQNNVFKTEAIIDFNKRPSTISYAASDVVQALKVPAGCCVTRVSWYVKTGQSSVTATIGDGDAAAGFDASCDLGTTGNKGCSLEADTYGAYGGKRYAAADTIDLTIGGADPTTLVVIITAEGYIFDNAIA